MIWLTCFGIPLGTGLRYPTWYPLVWISQVRTGGMTCRGYDNATVSIRFPDGAGWGRSVLLLPEKDFTTVAGLLRNNYTLEVDVNNPGLGTCFILFQDVSICFSPGVLCMVMWRSFFNRLQCLSEVSTQLHHLEFHYPNSK